MYWPSRLLDAWRDDCARRGAPMSAATFRLVEEDLARRGVRVRTDEVVVGAIAPGDSHRPPSA
jgi:hypothetical protein